MKPKIVVIGSINMDMVVRAPHIPKPGETVLGGTFLTSPGGKGANQAVAAARAGGDVTLIARVGTDTFGIQSIENLKKDSINIDFIYKDPEVHTGVALIVVDDKGENSITVASGANNKLSVKDIRPAEEKIKEAAIILLQLEIPLQMVTDVIEISALYKKPVILNPAPAQKLNPELLKKISIMTPNETEAEAMTGIAIKDVISAKEGAGKLKESGVGNVIITMGREGALLMTEDSTVLIASYPVQAVDTTAAGDVFNGALAVALAKNYDISDAVRFANGAAALSVQKEGAQSSAPTLKEIKRFLKSAG